MTNQPVWKCVANLGDANPIEYGGAFVYVDETGVYDPQLEICESPDGDFDDESDKRRIWTVYRFDLPLCWRTIGDGLGSNKFHPDLSEWFAPSKFEQESRPQDSNAIEEIGKNIDSENGSELLRDDLCSTDPIQRAIAYQTIGQYFGFNEFDAYPREYRFREIRNRYVNDLKALKAARATNS